MDGGGSSDEFSVVVLASDLGVDARPFLTTENQEDGQESWHDCAQYLSPDEDFSDLDLLRFFCLQGSDNSGSRILRIVGKYYPATVVSAERLKRYVLHKICSELPDGPFCIVYMHSTVQKEDNSPGLTILRWIYEELPADFKDRLQTVYFIHPGFRSRLVIATLGRLFLSGGLYWKIKYVSRLQYLWDDIKKGEIEIPEFVKSHDDILEHRPLTDYGIEPDPFHLNEMPSTAYSFGKYETRWAETDTCTKAQAQGRDRWVASGRRTKIKVNNRGIQMKGTLPHTETEMENPGSREEHDAEEALPENENITEVVEFLSENESFYSAEDSVIRE